MSKQVSFSASISAATMAVFALTALVGGFDKEPTYAPPETLSSPIMAAMP